MPCPLPGPFATFQCVRCLFHFIKQGQVFFHLFIKPVPDHFRAAGKLLDAHKGQLPTRLWVAPPTRMDAAQLTEEGYYSVFGKSGARIEIPGCSLCMGNQARVADGATVVSTSTRNFPNRLGTGANVFLASAELAAVAALIGKLPTPEEYQTYVAQVDKTAVDTYRYLNFNQLSQYTEKADGVIFQTAV